MLKSHNEIAEWLWGVVNKCSTKAKSSTRLEISGRCPPLRMQRIKIWGRNCFGISFLSIPGKVFSSIILKRCKHALDQVLREVQFAFRKSRGCTDELFALRQITDKCMTLPLDVKFCFFDFRAAIDPVDREMMHKISKQYWLHSQQLRKLQVLHQGRRLERRDVRLKNCLPG